MEGFEFFKTTGVLITFLYLIIANVNNCYLYSSTKMHFYHFALFWNFGKFVIHKTSLKRPIELYWTVSDQISILGKSSSPNFLWHSEEFKARADVVGNFLWLFLQTAKKTFVYKKLLSNQIKLMVRIGQDVVRSLSLWKFKAWIHAWFI